MYSGYFSSNPMNPGYGPAPGYNGVGVGGYPMNPPPGYGPQSYNQNPPYVPQAYNPAPYNPPGRSSCFQHLHTFRKLFL